MKICIVKLSAMGDIIHCMVVLQFIKTKFPNIQIDWIVENAFKDILQNNPHINNILPINLKSIKKNKLNIFKQLKLLNFYSKNSYDIIFDAQGLLKTAIVSKIISNKKSKIIGFDKNSIREKVASFFYDEVINIGYEKNVINRNIKLICDFLNIKVAKKDILNKQSFLYSKTITQDKEKNIILVVGASKPNKIYPKENFLQIAQILSNYKFEVIWANDNEKNTAIFLKQNSQNIIMCQQMDLDQLKLKIKNSIMVIGGDTGPTHMAWALNIPSITIFGNTPEYRNSYITPINKVIKSNSYVNPLKLNKNDFSINSIKPENITTLVKSILL
jgi:heptosyltransferase-1